MIKQDVKLFLDSFKQTLNTFGVLFVQRNKNIQALADLEITSVYREEVLRALKVEDYCEGPLANDQYGTNPMWVFGVTIKGKEVYIKITLIDKAICISFHESEHPMIYPLKENL